MGSDINFFCLENHFEYKDNIHYGIYRNFVVSIQKGGLNYMVNIAFNEGLEPECAKNIARDIGMIKAKYRPLQNALVYPVYVKIIYFAGSDLNEIFQASLDEIIDIVEKNHRFEIGKCPLCGNQLATNEPFLKVGEYVIQAHDACCDKLVADSHDLIKKTEDTFIKNKYALTLLILIGLGLTSFILNLVLSAFKFTALLFVSGWLVVIFAKLILAKMKTPVIKKVVNMILITAIVTLLVTEIPSILVYCMKYYELSLIDALGIWKTILADNVLVIALDLVLGGLLIALSVIPLYKSTKHASANTVKKL